MTKMTVAVAVHSRLGPLQKQGSRTKSATGQMELMVADATNQYHSVRYAEGRFVYAPILVESGSTASVRCSISDSGEATLKFTNGALTVVNNTSKNSVPMNCVEFRIFLRGIN